jgi:hypothetical protein
VPADGTCAATWRERRLRSVPDLRAALGQTTACLCTFTWGAGCKVTIGMRKIRRRSHVSSPRHMVGQHHRKPSSVTATPSTATFSSASCAAFKRWAFVTGRLRREPPWQNGYAERLIGSIRRDCLDHVVVFGERHLRHPLESYQRYYNEARTHLALGKDARFRGWFRQLAASSPSRSWEDCTINTSGLISGRDSGRRCWAGKYSRRSAG